MKTLKLKTGFHRQPNAQSSIAHDIFIYGVIGWHIDVKRLWDDLQNIPVGIQELNFYVHSPGGLVYEGFALLTNLSRLKNKYHTRGYIDGLAASMGSGLVVNMHETIASPTSKMIIHDPMFGLEIFGGFNRARLRELIEELGEIEENLEGDSDIIAWVYSQKTGLSVEQVKERWMNDGKDHEFTPQQMLEVGLIDSISENEFTKPPQVTEENEDDWMGQMAVGMRAACVENPQMSPYRGQHEKLFAQVAFNPENEDHNSSKPTGTRNSNSKSNGIMKFASIATKLGLDPNTGEDGINRAIENLENKFTQAETDKDQLQNLVDEYKETENQNKSELETLRTDLRKAKCSTVVDSIIEEAQKNVKGKVVNKNVRDQLNSLAVDQLKAEAEGKEKTANNLKDYMQLIAKNNLVPVGENPDLTDDNGSSARTNNDSPGTVDDERIKAAKERGLKKLEEQKKSWATNSVAV